MMPDLLSVCSQTLLCVLQSLGMTSSAIFAAGDPIVLPDDEFKWR